jgi:hypothetical protein
MKKTHFFIMLGLTVLYSCEKSKPTKLLLIQEKFHFFDSPYPDPVRKFSYSDDGKLIKYEESGNDEVHYYLNYYYSNDVMDSSEYYTKVSGVFTVSMITYYTFDSNNNLKSLINKGLGYNNTYIYNYKNERIDSIYWETVDDYHTIHGYYKYLTDNLGNIVWRHQVEDYFNDTVYYEYDNKINPFQKILILPGDQYGDVKYFSPNNCTKARDFSYRYEYNSRGFPVKNFQTEIQTSILRSFGEYKYAER